MNRPRRPSVVFACVAAALLAGCGDDGARVDPNTLPAPTFGEASIAGTVRFVGDPPPLPMIDTRGTCANVGLIQEETIVVSREGGLRDVVVWLTDAPASTGASLSAPVLDQVGCQYVPHVVGVQVGQPLKIKTSDPEYHNVHWNNGANPGVNYGFNTVGETRTVTLNAPEFIRTKCDVHPWMEAFIAVVPNPFFGVTDTDGRFTIPRVPAGSYKAKAWHHRLGERTGTVSVSEAGTATLDFEYARPTPR